MRAPAPPTAGPATDSPGPVTTTRAVVGDGTSAGSRARSRWRSARWPVGILAALVVFAGLTAIARPATSGTPLAPDNPGPEGARALAEVLGDQGVDVEYVRTVADAVAAAGPDRPTTLLVAQGDYLLPEQEAALAGTAADLVLVSPSEGLLDEATDGAAQLAYSWQDSDTPRDAECSDPAAQAAEQLTSTGVGFIATGTGDVTVCFPAQDEPDTGAYLVQDDGDRTVRAVDTAAVLRNGSITDDGAAALALWSLGANEHLVWLVPDPYDMSLTDDGGGDDDLAAALLPPWTGVVALQLLVVVLALALWRGRRLGPLVVEDLPVVVRSAETTRGRGRLYRRAGARGHAAAGLRADSADRLARSLGLPRSAGAETLVDAVARATGRPVEQVTHVLYGPPPADDAALLALARLLDQIESEVHHS